MIDVDVGVKPPPAREDRQLLASVSRPGASGTPARAHTNERAGRRGHSAVPLTSAPPTNDPFAELSIKYDGVDREALRPGAGTSDDGTGPGAGVRGDGRGLGIDAPLGLGAGGSLRVPPSPPSPPSQARPPRAKHDYSRWAFRGAQEYGGKKLLLELELDASGRVTAVRVLKSVDRHLDAWAIEVARRFEFHPALDDAGRPIAGAHRWEFVIEGVVDFGAGLGKGSWTEQRAGVTRSPP